VNRSTVRPSLSRAVAAAAVVAGVGAVVAIVAALGLPERSTMLDLGCGLVAAGALILAIVVPLRSRAMRRQNDQIRRQERTLAAAAFAADRFASDDGLADALPEVLERLGRATSSSRVYIFANSRDRQGQMLMSIRAEWCVEGVRQTLEDATNQRAPYTSGYMHWYRKLTDGVPVQVTRSDASGTEREDMDAEGSLAVAAVPIYVGGDWWGFLGVDDCTVEREWSTGELEALTVAAATYGAAIARQKWIDDLAEAEERFRVLVEQAPAVVYIDAVDAIATARYISPQVETMTGYSPDEWLRDPELWVRILHAEDRPEVLAAQEHHNETGEPFRMEYRLVTKDQREIWVRDEAVMIRNEDGSFRHSQGVLQDITDVRTAQTRIDELAYRDALTELPNLTMFTQLAEMSMNRAHHDDTAVAVLSVDIDGFKLANDSLGTSGGDLLLREIAKRVRLTLRDTDTLARRAADDFLVLLPDLDRGDYHSLQAAPTFAQATAERIRDSLKQPFDIAGREVYVTASIGISVSPDDAETVEELLLHAEHATRISKQQGPGGFTPYGTMAYDSAATFALVTRLRRAVQQRDWMLVYQPLVLFKTGAVHGVEALLRWTGEDNEQISPAEFIPLAEELGLIEDIGDWVVDELARQGQAWNNEGLRGMELGFNLSPRQFFQPELAERLMARLAERAVRPEHIVVEITETSAMRDADRSKAILWELHSRGLKLALDDFGTGYSSLSRLRELPVDILKIDRSFVTGVDLDPQAAKIVAAFIQLGQALEMTTLAEGIETEGEYRFLADHGCDLGQGFYFSRPLPAREISSRWRSGEITLASGAAPPADPTKREVARVWQPGAPTRGR
jgi:diguanylate cyclase (GGDEF)-like protein/PAS domain S-box-containing protein